MVEFSDFDGFEDELALEPSLDFESDPPLFDSLFFESPPLEPLSDELSLLDPASFDVPFESLEEEAELDDEDFDERESLR